jgi:hypothetical protein
VHPKKVLARKLFYQLKICLSPKKNPASFAFAQLFLLAVLPHLLIFQLSCLFASLFCQLSYPSFPFTLIRIKVNSRIEILIEVNNDNSCCAELSRALPELEADAPAAELPGRQQQDPHVR